MYEAYLNFAKSQSVLMMGCNRNPKMVEKIGNTGDIMPMVTVKADNHSRIKLPDAKPGQIFALENNGDSSVTITPVKTVERKPSARLGKKDGYTVIIPDQPINLEALKESLDNFP